MSSTSDVSMASGIVDHDRDKGNKFLVFLAVSIGCAFVTFNFEIAYAGPIVCIILRHFDLVDDLLDQFKKLQERVDDLKYDVDYLKEDSDDEEEYEDDDDLEEDEEEEIEQNDEKEENNGMRDIVMIAWMMINYASIISRIGCDFGLFWAIALTALFAYHILSLISLKLDVMELRDQVKKLESDVDELYDEEEEDETDFEMINID